MLSANLWLHSISSTNWFLYKTSLTTVHLSHLHRTAEGLGVFQGVPWHRPPGQVWCSAGVARVFFPIAEHPVRKQSLPPPSLRGCSSRSNLAFAGFFLPGRGLPRRQKTTYIPQHNFCTIEKNFDFKAVESFGGFIVIRSRVVLSTLPPFSVVPHSNPQRVNLNP